MYILMRIIRTMQILKELQNTELEPIEPGLVISIFKLIPSTFSFCRSSPYHEPTYDSEKVRSDFHQYKDIRYRTFMDRFEYYSCLYFSPEFSGLIRKSIGNLVLGFVLIYIFSLIYFVSSYKSGCRCSRCRLYGGNENI